MKILRYLVSLIYISIDWTKGSQISSTSHQELLKRHIAFHTIHIEESISLMNFLSNWVFQSFARAFTFSSFLIHVSLAKPLFMKYDTSNFAP